LAKREIEDLNNASSTGELHAFELRTTPENSAYYASKYLIFQRLTPYVKGWVWRITTSP
jgi:hypothetical protein